MSRRWPASEATLGLSFADADRGGEPPPSAGWFAASHACSRLYSVSEDDTSLLTATLPDDIARFTFALPRRASEIFCRDYSAAIAFI